MQILSKDFQKTLDKYHQLLENRYDDKFKTYAQYIKDAVYDEIDAYMLDDGADHWSCVAEVYVNCCADCGWRACTDGCDDSCGEGESGYQNKTVDCPTSRPGSTIGSDATTIYWHLDNEDAFLKDIADEHGIQESWITYTAQRVGLGVGCLPGDHDCGAWWFGYPTKKDHIEVPNPKDVISSAMTNLTIVKDELADAVMDAQAMVYIGSTLDVVTGSELPVFMTEFAVDSMKEVTEAAEEIKEAQKKQMILNSVMAILMIIPAVGEAIGAIGLATIGRIIVMTGAAGDVALGVYGVVEDPKSAIIALFTALVGLRGGTGFAEAARIRRGMSSKEVSALGQSFKDKSDLLDSIRKTCKT